MLKTEFYTGTFILLSVIISLISADAVFEEKKNDTSVKTVDNDTFVFYVNYTGSDKPCIIARFSAAFQITYLAQNGSSTTHSSVVNMTKPDKYSGSCMEQNNTLKITFRDQWILEMTYSNHKSEYALTRAKLTYKIDSDLFPNATNLGLNDAENTELSEFNVIVGKSYKCYSLSKIDLNQNVTIDFRNYQAQALIKADTKTEGFDTAVECVADIVGSNKLVPIIIGIVLIVLVALVLVAYVIGRRRYRPTYQQV
ncbi:lysosome-associated membrane glyco 1-like isoform X1 [Brachionus plicatilis]|uniref:Lysosome-associated membrane glycoprotein 5 n=1 Tax=Brachionus plicatilis TaxID=10195 RepID=A0A3M7RBH7_BRAPC|nr:lysosome-associated membrane glyco 1-like isoform X1 [Brachionus plicatilis]